MTHKDPRAIYIGSDYLVEMFGLFDELTNAFQNSATMTAQVFELDQVSSVGDSITMAYVNGSDGNYQGVFGTATTNQLQNEQAYFVKVVINSGGINDTRWLKRTAYFRGSQ